MKPMAVNRFNKLKREHETVDAYVYTSLHSLAKTCNFDQSKNDFIRDRVVTGIRHNVTRKLSCWALELLSMCYRKKSQENYSAKMWREKLTGEQCNTCYVERDRDQTNWKNPRLQVIILKKCRVHDRKRKL